MFAVEIYPPLQDKIHLPIAEMREAVVDTAGQGLLSLTYGYLKKKVSTCNQYQSALDEGYRVPSDYDVSMLSFYTFWCGSLDWLAKAKPAKKSFIQEFTLSQSFGMLPSKIFFSRLGDSTYKNSTLIEKYPDLTLLTINGRSITLESKKANIRAIISLLAKADFTHDGQQDLLLSIAEYSMNDSYHQYGVFSLSRHSNHGQLVINP